MRLLFFLVLLVNAAAFAYFTSREPGSSQTKPVLPAVNAERIRLVQPEQSTSNGGASPKLSCWVWSGIKEDSFSQARTALEALALGDRLLQPAKEEYWIYIAPLRNRQDAEKKIAELKSLTIEDGAVVGERGKWRFAISFAAYPTEDAATVRLNELKEKGVKSAKILKREAVGDSFIIQHVDEKTADALNKLQASFVETTIKPVDCAIP